MKLSVCMAIVDNYSQLRATIQDIRRDNDCTNVEFVVCDNKPSAASSRRSKRLVEQWVHGRGNAGAKYIPLPTHMGTAVAKQKAIDEATGDVIVLMDSHVWLRAGWIEKAFKFFNSVGRTKDLYNGPLLYDDLGHAGYGSSHFDAHWRSEMWGVWGSAWGCSCYDPFAPQSEQPGKLQFSFNGVSKEPGRISFYALSRSHLIQVTECGACGRKLPELAINQPYQRILKELGYHRLGENREHAPFKIPGCGMGFAMFWKDAWPGYNPNFVGFGGEEMYINKKLEAAGGETWCLPEFQWDHEFSEPTIEPLKYRASHWHSMRNYVIGCQELGEDIQQVHDHFIDGAKTTEAQWDYLLKDPIAHVEPAEKTAPPGELNSQPPAEMTDIKQIYEWVKVQPRNYAAHMDFIKTLAVGKDVIDITRTRESYVAVIAASPRSLTCHSQSREPLFKRLSSGSIKVNHVIPPLDTRFECELLIVDDKYTDEVITARLEKNYESVTFGIAIHGVREFAETGENGLPGFATAIGRFLGKHPEWAVLALSPPKSGMCLLGDPKKAKMKALMAPFWKPTSGPGTEMKKLLASIGVTEKPGCDCNAKAGQMDVWGVEGCRIHRDTILENLRDGLTRWKWSDMLKAAARAVGTGLAFSIDPTDPIASVYDMAVMNAESLKMSK